MAFFKSLKTKLMKKASRIIGADLSKRKIDLHDHQSGTHVCIDNSNTGFRQLLKWFKRLDINVSEVMIVMEHTGLYSYCFEQLLHQEAISFCKLPALVIKRSQGFVRGKTDKVDAKRIAKYGFDHQEELKAEEVPSAALLQLQHLYSTRESLVKTKSAMLNGIKELQNIGMKSSNPALKAQLSLLKTCEQQIASIEKEIDLLIEKNEDLQTNHTLLLSIKGVGRIVSIATILKTKNFKRFNNARKFACYSGTAPFEHSSGSSVRGKTRVSHLADKSMKTLLDLAAKSAINHDKELKHYYQQKVASGKPKMSVINVVRNKIIYRMFAVIKRQTPFKEDYLIAA